MISSKPLFGGTKRTMLSELLSSLWFAFWTYFWLNSSQPAEERWLAQFSTDYAYRSTVCFSIYSFSSQSWLILNINGSKKKIPKKDSQASTKTIKNLKISENSIELLGSCSSLGSFHLLMLLSYAWFGASSQLSWLGIKKIYKFRWKDQRECLVLGVIAKLFHPSCFWRKNVLFALNASQISMKNR